MATSVRLDFSQPKKVPDTPRRGRGRDVALYSVLEHPGAGRALTDADAALGHFGEGGTSRACRSKTQLIPWQTGGQLCGC